MDSDTLYIQMHPARVNLPIFRVSTYCEELDEIYRLYCVSGTHMNHMLNSLLMLSYEYEIALIHYVSDQKSRYILWIYQFITSFRFFNWRWNTILLKIFTQKMNLVKKITKLEKNMVITLFLHTKCVNKDEESLSNKILE